MPGTGAASPIKMKETVLNAEGRKKEAAVVRQDEGMTAVKRRMIDKEESTNTQSSVKTADTYASELKISPQVMEMS